MARLDPLAQKAIAEIVGVFAFFFAGISAIVLNPSTDPGSARLIVAFAHGIMLAIMISGLGAISGGHFNPAISFGLFVGRQIDATTMLVYWAAQLVGGVLAALAVHWVYPQSAWAASHIGLPDLAPGVSVGSGIALEIIMTFFLVLAVFGTAVDPRHPPIGGLGIGLTVFVDILFGGGRTGASMNPARTFGPALVANRWDNHLVYWVGPLIGGAIAGALYYYAFWPRPQEAITGEAPGFGPGLARTAAPPAAPTQPTGRNRRRRS